MAIIIMNRAAMLAMLLALQSTFALGFSPSVAHRRSSGRHLVLQATPSTSVDTIAETNLANNNEVDEIASELLKTCADFGQIGSKLTEDQRGIIDNLASSLSTYSDPAPAQIDLQGRHELIYSAAPGASSGAVGPLVGEVGQSFLDDTKFINRVELLGGIVKIELNAERKVLDENRIRVKFIETAFSIFGNEVKR